MPLEHCTYRFPALIPVPKLAVLVTASTPGASEPAVAEVQALVAIWLICPPLLPAATVVVGPDRVFGQGPFLSPEYQMTSLLVSPAASLLVNRVCR